MSFTTIFALLVLLGLAIIFWVFYNRKGLRAAIITTGIMLFIYACLFAVVLYVVNRMLQN